MEVEQLLIEHEKRKQYAREYARRNKEKISEHRRKYYQENREKILEKQRARSKQYYEANKDRLRERALKRYHDSRGAAPPYVANANSNAETEVLD